MNPFLEWIRSFDELLGTLSNDNDDENNNNVKKQLVL